MVELDNAAQRPPPDGLDVDNAAQRMETGERHSVLSRRQGELSLVSTHRGRHPHAQMREYGASSLAVALAVFALGFVAMQGTGRTALESEGMKEYNVAQAKALLASDEVEVRNSNRRLGLMKDKLAGEQESAEGKGVDEKGLSKVLLSKAEDYELQADLSAATKAKLQLQDKKVPKLAKQEASTSEEDDKLYARALRRAAERSSTARHHVEHVHLFLQQYGTTTQLKVGELREERSLHAAEARMRIDRKNVELLLAAQPKSDTKVDAEEEEAMAIENLEKSSA